jgi:hypothetical protein
VTRKKHKIMTSTDVYLNNRLAVNKEPTFSS